MLAAAPTPPPFDDSGVLAQLMPNRIRAKFMRAAAIFCCVVTLLASLPPAYAILSLFNARHHWQPANGEIRSAQEKSAWEQPAGTHGRRSVVYWADFEVGFQPPDGNCRTGETVVPPAEFPCIAHILTPHEKSRQRAVDWLVQYRQNAAAKFLCEPAGPGVIFADTSVGKIYPADKITVLLGMAIFSAIVLSVTQRRLALLLTLPEDYTASPPSPPPANPNELTDLKLS
jgi:hypothetical protein